MRFSLPWFVPALCAVLAVPAVLVADVTCEQTVTIVRGSGKLAVHGMPGIGGGNSVVTKVYVHGDRMLRSFGKTEELIDLEKQTVTAIQHDKKAYSVLTFEQYGTALHLPAPGPRKDGAPAPGEAKFDARVEDMNRTKNVNGVALRQMLVTVTQDTGASENEPIELTMEAWIASDEGGTDEYSEFNKNLAEKLGTSADVNQFPEHLTPLLRQGLIRLLDESHKLPGVLIEQSTRVTGPKGAGFDSGTHTSARDVGRDAKSGAKKVGRGIGNIFGRVAGGVISSGPGGNVPTPDKAPVPTGGGVEDDPGARGESGDLMEMAMHTSVFHNQDVDAARFAVPAGYRQVESELLGGSQK